MDPKVDDLFRWYKETTIGDRKVWLRTLGATDDSERLKAAMRASRKMRAKLIREGSPEREDMLEAYEGIGREELLVAIRAFRTEEARARVENEVQPTKDPPEPEDKTITAVMDAEDAWEEELVELVRRREEWIREHVDVIMERDHAGQSDEELFDEAIRMQISVFCTEAYLQEFERQSVYRACFEDKKFTQKTFNSVEQAGEAGKRVFQKLLGEYWDLDSFGLSQETLKN